MDNLERLIDNLAQMREEFTNDPCEKCGRRELRQLNHDVSCSVCNIKSCSNCIRMKCESCKNKCCIDHWTQSDIYGSGYCTKCLLICDICGPFCPNTVTCIYDSCTSCPIHVKTMTFGIRSDLIYYESIFCEKHYPSPASNIKRLK